MTDRAAYERIKNLLSEQAASMEKIETAMMKEITKLRTLVKIHSVTLLVIAVSLTLHTWLTK